MTDLVYVMIVFLVVAVFFFYFHMMMGYVIRSIPTRRGKVHHLRVRCEPTVGMPPGFSSTCSYYVVVPCCS